MLLQQFPISQCDTAQALIGPVAMRERGAAVTIFNRSIPRYSSDPLQADVGKEHCFILTRSEYPKAEAGQDVVTATGPPSKKALTYPYTCLSI